MKRNNFFVKLFMLPVFVIGLITMVGQYHLVQEVSLTSVTSVQLQTSASSDSFSDCVKTEEANQLAKWKGLKVSTARRKVIHNSAVSICTKRQKAEEAAAAKKVVKKEAAPAAPTPTPTPVATPPEEPVAEPVVAPAPAAPELPDFSVNAFRFNEDYSTFYIDMSNNGAALSENLKNSWILSVYLDDINYAMLTSGSVRKDALFAANGTFTEEVDTIGGFARLKQGTHHVRACVGSAIIEETSMDNNCLEMDVNGEPLPDLRFDSIRLSDDLSELLIDMRNDGGHVDASVLNSFILSVYLDDIDYAMLTSGASRKDALFTANGSFVQHVSTDGGFARLTQGVHHVRACLGSQLIQESNSDNNCMELDVNGESLPEMNIASIRLSDDLSELLIDMRNDGGHVAENLRNSWILNVYLDDIDYAMLTSGAVGKDHLFDRNGSYIQHVGLEGGFARLSRGTHHVRACIGSQLIEEINNDNNCLEVDLDGAFVPIMNATDVTYNAPGVLRVLFDNTEGLADFLENTVQNEMQRVELCYNDGFRDRCVNVSANGRR